MTANPLFVQIEKNIFSNFKHLPKVIGKIAIQHKDVTIISCGFSTLSFNIVCDTAKCDKSYENIVQRVDNFYGKKPYVWWLGVPTMPSHFNLFLNSQGFKLFSVENAMICDLTIKRDLSPIENLKVEQAKSIKHLKDFSKVLSKFEIDIDTIYVNKLLISPEFKKINPLFIGYIDNQPVATVSLNIHKKIASLHDLVTEEEFQNKGIGTSMVKHMMKYLQDKAISKVCLTSNANSGFNIYKEMGFEVVGGFECYLSHENYR